MSFTADLKLGHEVERAVVAELVKENPLWGYGYGSSGSDKGADYRLNVGIECKFDALAATTGNVAIEVACNGKPSGISATTATFWATVISGGEHDGIFIHEVPVIRHFIQGRFAIKGGDRSAVAMVLIPVASFIAMGRRLCAAPSFLAMRRP